MYKSTIWNTELINETLQKLRYGAPIDMSCFYQRDPTLKAPNILFQLTPEEENEFNYCSENIVYFVEKYCKFLTDRGRETVDLRDYQQDILSTLAKEKWIESIEDFGPEVRDYILMASRQIGKCLLFNTQITIRLKSTNRVIKISIGDLYDKINKQNKKNFKQQIIYNIKKILYNIYSKLS